MRASHVALPFVILSLYWLFLLQDSLSLPDGAKNSCLMFIYLFLSSSLSTFAILVFAACPPGGAANSASPVAYPYLPYLPHLECRRSFHLTSAKKRGQLGAVESVPGVASFMTAATSTFMAFKLFPKRCAIGDVGLLEN